MEIDSSLPNGTADSSRRKSGRVSRAPAVFADEEHAGSLLQNGSATKRKRVNHDDIQDSDADESDEDSDESEPAEEEIRAKRREQKKRPAAAKPAPKRAKTAAKSGATLAIRSANVPSKPANKAQKLYAEVFGKGQTAEDVANQWIATIAADSVAAIRDLVNFVLKCVECDVEITSADIEDIDNVPGKLGDVLEEHYNDKAGAEYPLISKAKQYVEFKTVLVEFFDALIKSLHISGILYDQPEVYDNIHVWVGTMSGAKYRPFRHTATVISLSMSTALCSVASEILQSMATTKTQLDAEQKSKKKASNKTRIASLQESIKTDEKRLELVDASLRDAFDTVYVHRYRDVDEKIRVECVAALGGWISKYRKMFLEGQYLRYLGWVMSDPNSPTRLEVIRQVKQLYGNKRNVTALRAFTDRFRPRMVEMGARDADVGVRVESIELLDRLRNYDLLEPEDIDTIGRLIFDAEPRVRKTVGKFFVSNIEDLYKDATEDWDEEQYNDALPSADDGDDQMAPNQNWIKFKCLAETLKDYDARSESANSTENNVRTLASTDNAESRYMLATQAIYTHMKELEEWESLAGYLLYDHSSITADPESDDVATAVQGKYKLANNEETILLDVLYFSVKMYLSTLLELAKDKKGRTHAAKDNIKTKQETVAHNLSTFIPQLLSRYGSTTDAATSILRLEQLLDADLISDLQGGEATYSNLLEDINKQFMTHSDVKVLAEASRAFRAARSFEQSQEATDTKSAESGRRQLPICRACYKLVNLCIRISNLAGVVDCTDIIEQSFAPPKAAAAKKGKKAAPAPPAIEGTLFDLLIRLIERGDNSHAMTGHDRFAAEEDQLCAAVATTLSLYFRWKVVGLIRAIENKDERTLTVANLVDIGTKRNNFVEVLTPIITSRSPLDQLRVAAIHTLLDIYTLFATLKHRQPKASKGELDDEPALTIAALTVPIPDELLTEVMATHERLEKSFARKTSRKILEHKNPKSRRGGSRAGTTDVDGDDDEREATQAEIERPPDASDDEEEDSDADSSSGADDEDAEPSIQEGGGKEAKKQRALIAEQKLCEVSSKIVLALLGGVIGNKVAVGVKEAIQLNRTKLGKSYAEVVKFLDEKKDKKTAAKDKSKSKATQQKSREKVTPEPMELEEDEIVDIDDVEDGHDALQREIVEEEEADRLEEEMRERDGDDGDDGEGEGEDEVIGD
ncbi:Cohesin subunit psc3 [Cyphellophora attinorum]|uniref:Cohesin subunit psc3 n=1 Tax=Cyphellophora attinorum TaxID=1664694 RepID=A0A0N1HRG3_9EURO|nr:Cohesin subunit psc3 [Phialophora attinorum]KPI38374.1 Cohesin subunit psc3 [Phialophora attinorum]